jgi:hypothetical protein
MGAIEASVVDAAWQEVARLKESRIPIEMGKASREQPELLAFILGSTEGMGPGISELAGFIYFVIWRVFRAGASSRMKPVTAGAIQRRLEQNERELMILDGTDPGQIDEAALARLTRQPAVFRYVIEAIAEAEEDESAPVAMSPEEKGSLILLLKTAIDALDEARERAS